MSVPGLALFPAMLGSEPLMAKGEMKSPDDFLLTNKTTPPHNGADRKLVL